MNAQSAPFCPKAGETMNYQQRPGIVLTKLCDMHVLIPSRAAYDACRTIRPLTKLWAITWEQLGREDAEERIMTIHRILTRKPDEEIRANLDAFLRDLASKGFLIESDSGSTEIE